MAKDQILFTEKYRPKTVQECILPGSLKQTFQGFVDQGEMPNLLLVGSAGTGKTTVARALCEEMGIEYLFVNASLEGNIDTLRTKIQKYASSVSLMSDKRKFVILDEADYLNKQSTQPALRAFMEEFSSNCGFIMTCNFQNKLIEPLWSRSAVIEFKYPARTKPEFKELCVQFLDRCEALLEKENVEYDRKVVAKAIGKRYPDWRRVLNELQQHSANGKLGTDILLSEYADIDALVNHIRDKDFKAIRQWAAENSDTDTSHIFKRLFSALTEVLENYSIPKSILILNEAQKADAIVADKELNMAACFVELMAELAFKDA